MARTVVQIRCPRSDCGRRLGSYELILTADEPGLGGLELGVLAPVRLASVDLWDGLGAEPPVNFKLDHSMLRVNGERMAIPKYRWRCGCGTRPAVRADTVAERVRAGRPIL